MWLSQPQPLEITGKSPLVTKTLKQVSRFSGCGGMENLIPHVFGMLHRLETQISEIDRFREEHRRELSLESRSFFQDHLPQLRRTTSYLRRQIVLLNLAKAKGQSDFVDRQIRLVYGVFEMLRPELTMAMKAARNKSTERKQVRANVH